MSLLVADTFGFICMSGRLHRDAVDGGILEVSAMLPFAGGYLSCSVQASGRLSSAAASMYNGRINEPPLQADTRSRGASRLTSPCLATSYVLLLWRRPMVCADNLFVSRFRQRRAQLLGRGVASQPTGHLRRHPQYNRAASWLAHIAGRPHVAFAETTGGKGRPKCIALPTTLPYGPQPPRNIYPSVACACS